MKRFFQNLLTFQLGLVALEVFRRAVNQVQGIAAEEAGKQSQVNRTGADQRQRTDQGHSFQSCVKDQREEKTRLRQLPIPLQVRARQA